MAFVLNILNLELCECSHRGWNHPELGWAAETAAEVDASGEHAAAAETGAIGEQQLEADANREQQLKRILQSGPGAAADSKWTQAASSS